MSDRNSSAWAVLFGRDQKRHGKGTSEGGQFAPEGGAKGDAGGGGSTKKPIKGQSAILNLEDAGNAARQGGIKGDALTRIATVEGMYADGDYQEALEYANEFILQDPESFNSEVIRAVRGFEGAMGEAGFTLSDPGGAKGDGPTDADKKRAAVWGPPGLDYDTKPEKKKPARRDVSKPQENVWDPAQEAGEGPSLPAHERIDPQTGEPLAPDPRNTSVSKPVDLGGSKATKPAGREMQDGTTQIDHTEYPKYLKSLDDAALAYTIKDAAEAMAAMPEGHKAGYYADEINYAAMELKSRRDA